MKIQQVGRAAGRWSSRWGKRLADVAGRGNEKSSPRGLLLEFGAGNRSRTYDLRITNALLYQLSYAGKTICLGFDRLSGLRNNEQKISKTSLFFPVRRPVYGA
jgi:hypothetical protein